MKDDDQERIKAYMAAKMAHIKMYNECMNLADGLDVAKFAELVRADEREKVAKWMMEHGYATGHGDTIEDLLAELEWQVAEREREAVLEAIEALTGMEADRHKMFSEGYDHALYHIRQVVEGRSKKYAMYALQQAIEFEEMVKKGTKAWDGTPDDWVDELRGGAEKREWVGLTDEDIYKVIEENIPPQLNTLFDMAKWVGGVIEAKLKEKNGWQ